MLKIAIAQMDVVAGQPSLNFERMKEWILQAKVNKADIIVFPELCLTGYILGDQWTDQTWVEFAASFNEKIKSLSSDIGIIWGNVHVLANRLNQDGRIAKANAAFFAYQGEWVVRQSNVLSGIYIKHLQPNYRIFDERRHFLNALDVVHQLNLPHDALLQPFQFKKQGKNYSIALEVCEDLWDENYDIKINARHVASNVNLVVNLSSSPWTIDKEKSRHKQGLRLRGVPWIYVNRTGVENNGKNVMVYDGGSFVYNEQGVLTHTLNDAGKPELKTIDFDQPFISQQPTHKLYTMLVEGLRYFHHDVLGGRLQWVVGLSGGIDSAVSTALLAHAIGPEKIYAYSLPTQYNSAITQHNAETIAKALGVHFQMIPIQPMVDAFTQHVPSVGQTTLGLENIQARVRGSLLMNEAQRLGAVVLNNGNKIEIALGYATLYGDTIGAISPLGDLTKLQIIELAQFINLQAKQSIIPLNLIPVVKNAIPMFDIAPSAELKANQIDPMKWGYHDWLIQTLMSFPSLACERILQMYIQKKFPADIVALIKHYHLDQGSAFIQDLEWVMQAWSKGIFKRIQLPPNILVSRGAFGFDYRESQMNFEQTSTYVALRKSILTLTY
jgi:NAD+ synthase (glutamine-hydrolysing)